MGYGSDVNRTTVARVLAVIVALLSISVLFWPNSDPKEAAAGTLRKLYAADKGQNAVHGSDSTENAAIEIAYFFRTTEIH